MSARWGHNYLYVVGMIVGAAVATAALPTSVGAQTSQSVPVIDEGHIEVSEKILETNQTIKGLLEDLVRKELKEDPKAQHDAQKQLVEKKKKALEDVQQNYQGYRNNKYLEKDAYEDTFVETDPQQFLRDVTNSEFNRYLSQNFSYDVDQGSFNFSGDTSNLKKTIANSLEANMSEEKSPQQTMDRVTGGPQQTAAFKNGDFSKGGFDAWFEMSADKSNMPTGAYLQAQKQASKQIISAQNAEMNKLNWYDGVHGKTNDQGETVTPGSVYGQRLQDVMQFCDKGLLQFDEHPQTKQAAASACETIEQKIRTGGVLDGDFLSMFDQFASNLFNFDFSNEFDNLLGQIESEAQNYAQSVVSSIL